jgi:signal peptidase II
VFAYAIDRITKALAVRSLAGHDPIVLIPHVLDLRYTENSGGAFSILGGHAWLFFLATIAICMVIVAAAFRLTSRLTALGLGLILGGALGNLTDRITRGSGISGRVVDFIHLHNWPVFNLADSSIVVGAILVVLVGMRRRDEAS